MQGERFLTRIDAVLCAASRAALFVADAKGGGADEDGGRQLHEERRAAAQIEMEVGGAARGRCCCRPAES